MSTAGEGSSAAAREAPGGGFLVRLRLAAGFLTILPLMPAKPAAEETVAASFAYFPLVGFAMGAAFAAGDCALSRIAGPALGSVLVVLAMALVTGAVHLDGLADTADALGARGDHERALAILRDRGIGSFGACALFFVLALKIAALAALGGWRRADALILAPGLARWSMVAVGYGLEYLRPAGAGAILLGRNSEWNVRAASAIALAAFLPFSGGRALGAYAAALVVTAGLRRFYLRWLGGITGDLAGACGEIVETAALLAFAL